ncbi:fatty acyl-AMP ligase [Plantactinospora endophytica]|uniref:Polyketide synthase n=1 Tax=Plantactinospora endophytica TaxID=673535 RepID=A0ABQ4EBU6_9ACTN|nr:fatty acyl-AMP ligase [Plantactinospora endophytica]GIG92120.1 polyketide synthase [Plantactinospora endophytica]
MTVDGESGGTGIRELPDAIEAVRRWAARRPSSDALIWVEDPGERRDERLSYAELDEQARAVAVWLRERCPVGSRVLLLYSPVRFIVGFLGCLYAGMVAVPAPLPGRYRHEQRRVRGIAADAEVAAVLTETAHLATVREFAAAGPLAELEILATDGEVGTDPGSWQPPSVHAGTLALLQYTSGSTGDPKGVMVTHGNLLHNTATLLETLRVPAGLRFGGWAPHYHDMGLMAQTLPALFAGSTCVLMEPVSFLKRPLAWLTMIDKYDIGWSPAPNFAYDYCVERISDEQIAGLDLSRWKYAVNGSEPVRVATMRGFARRFAPAGFSADACCPCYGLAEATVFVSGAPPRPLGVARVDAAQLAGHRFRPASGDAGIRELPSNGTAPEYDVRIVDPATRAVLEPGRVGEIWLRGPSVTSGYWRRPEATAQVLGAVTADGDAGYLRTGDLGTVHDGELYVTGRIKEMMIIHGRNLYPQDVEHELRGRHPGLGNVGAVFTLAEPDSSGDDLLVVVHEVTDPRDRPGLARLAGEIRHTVAREFGVGACAVILLRRGGVRRTTSGKIERTAMRELVRNGELTAEHVEVDARWRDLVPVQTTAARRPELV